MNLSQLPPSFAFPLNATVSSWTWVPGQFDSDGRTDLLVFNPAQDTIAILAGFRYQDLDPRWPLTPAAQLITAWAGSAAALGIYRTASLFAADIDASGTSAVIAIDALRLAATSYRWSATAGLTAAGTTQAFFPPSPNGDGTSWMLNFEQTFSFADVDGDGAAELIAFDKALVKVGVMKWQNGGWYCLWAGGIFYPAVGGDGNSWGVTALQSFQSGDVDGNGKTELIFSDTIPGVSLGVIIWQGHSLKCALRTSQFPPAPNFGGAPWDIRFDQTLRTGRVSGGPGVDLIALDALTQAIGVMQWQNGQFVVIWEGSLCLAAPESQTGPWQFSGREKFWLANMDGGNNQNILVRDPILLKIGVLKWERASLECLWEGNTPPSSPSFQGHPWALTPTEVFSSADLFGDRQSAVLVFDPVVGFLGGLQFENGALTWKWGTLGAVTEYGMRLLGNAPSTTFTQYPFTGEYLQIYSYMGSQLPECPIVNGLFDIRSAYENTARSDWDDLSKALAALPKPGQYSQDRWNFVQRALLEEFAGINPLNNLTTEMNQVLTGVYSTQQEAQLSTAYGNLPPAAPSGAAFWVGQIMDALIWGAAVGPEEKKGQAALAIIASLFGSVASAIGGDSQANISYTALTGQINQYTSSSVSASNQNQTTILGDKIMLPAAGRLILGPWAWNSGTASSAITSPKAENTCRLAFYQTLIPAAYQVMLWKANSEPYPTSQNIAPINEPPSYAYWADPTGDGFYDVYLLFAAGGPYGYLKYPTQTMMDDLFKTLGVYQADLFKGTFGWEQMQTVAGI